MEYLKRYPISVLNVAVVLRVLFHCACEIGRHKTLDRMTNWKIVLNIANADKNNERAICMTFPKKSGFS